MNRAFCIYYIHVVFFILYIHNLLYQSYCVTIQVCNPHRLAQKKDCLIYSVGSNGKAEFEKAVIEEIGNNCEIHSK